MALKDEIETGPKRDRWGRPLLVPKEAEYVSDSTLAYYLAHTAGAERAAYARASSLSDYASGVKTGLEVWKRRQAAVGIARREDIAAMIAALPDMDSGDRKLDQITKTQLDEYLEMAHEASGANAKANWGTAVHGFTADGDPGHVPERMQADVDAYFSTMRALGIKVLLNEFFVANDDLAAAGTCDHLVLLPDGDVVVADKKTAEKGAGRLDTCIQLSVYAGGDVYDWEDDSRVSLHDIAESLGGTFNPDRGLLIDIPKGKGQCVPVELDLSYGRWLATMAARLRVAGLSVSREKVIGRSNELIFLDAVHDAQSTDELTQAMKWGPGTSDLRDAANKRWAELTTPVEA